MMDRLKERGGKTIAVYEKDPAVSSYLEMLLQDCGFVVPWSVSRKEDLPAAIANLLPDVVVISHPKAIDALEVAEGIGGQHPQIVLCTDGKVPSRDFESQALGIIEVVSRTVTGIGCLIGALSRCDYLEARRS
jgi:hypothetical protein